MINRILRIAVFALPLVMVALPANQRPVQEGPIPNCLPGDCGNGVISTTVLPPL